MLVESGAIYRIYSVFNRELASNFVTQRGILARRMQTDAELFRKADWKEADRVDLRQRTLQHFQQTAAACPWAGEDGDDMDNVPIIPMVHGTAGVVAWKIVENGFSALSSLDAGYYGCGIY